MDAFKLLLLLAAIVAAVRFRVAIGVVLLGASGLTLLLWPIGLSDLGDAIRDLGQSSRLYLLTGLFLGVTLLGRLLKERRYLHRLAAAVRSLPGGRRVATASLPALIGLMPMPGGSLLSAPLVNEVLRSTTLPADFRCVANYWFRHMVEFTWPIYPGVILTSAIAGISIVSVSLLHLPLTVGMFLLGWFWFARRIPLSPASHPNLRRGVIGIVQALWPIGVALILPLVVGLPLVAGIGAGIVMLVLREKISWRELWSTVHRAISVNLILLVLGVLLFERLLDASGAISTIPELTNALGIPDWLTVVLVCFTIGVLTGIVAAYVGLGYPLLAPLLYSQSVDMQLLIVAYLSGYVGMLLSPTHLCLVLTHRYFGAPLADVYRRLAFPLTVLALFGGLLAVSGWGSVVFRYVVGP